MTVLTMATQPGQATALRPVPWRRMVWSPGGSTGPR
jgi:hypothetical protein